MRLALLGACLIATSCTQDFDQFEPDGADAASAGATSVSSSATSVGATGGEGGRSSSSSSSSGGATSSSGGGSPEDCEDAVDNDNDTMVDCADSDCASFECAAAVPSGWSGYYRLHEVPFPNPAPSPCPDASAPSTYFRDPAPAECGACTCGAWAGATCGAPELTCWLASGTCQGTGTDLTQFVQNGSCYDVPNVSGTTQRSCRLTEAAMVMDPGACPPAGGALTNPNPWVTQSDACAEPPTGGAGCRGGGVCIPKGSGDYAGPACIYADGVQACPAGFGTALVAYASGTDNRSCTGCQCNVQGAACNNGSYTIYDQNACASTTQVVGSSACVNVSAQLDMGTGSIQLTPAMATGGSCVVGGGVPTGAVVPAGPITICCP